MQQNSQNLLMPGKLEKNVLRIMKLTNAATYNIGHDVTKSQNPLMPGKLEQNVLHKMNLVKVTTDNIGHEVTKSTFSCRENSSKTRYAK